MLSWLLEIGRFQYKVLRLAIGLGQIRLTFRAQQFPDTQTEKSNKISDGKKGPNNLSLLNQPPT